MTLPTSNRPLQKAWIVRDIEASAHLWSASLNVGPFYIAEYTPDTFETITYRGKPGKLHMKTAITYAGDEQIELVEPVGDYPCAYSDTVQSGSSGFHHLCFWSDDIDADLAHYLALGYPAANVGKMAGGPRFAYVDASSELSCMIELLERSSAVEELFASWKKAAETWDGREAVIRL